MDLDGNVVEQSDATCDAVTNPGAAGDTNNAVVQYYCQ